MVAQKHPGSEAKNEVWYIVDHKENSQIYAGLRHDRTQLQFRTRELEKMILKNVFRFSFSKGGCFCLPAGTVHCVGGGNLVLEIMQNSDTTYRIHDWGRVDNDGNPRDLHIEQALECIHFKDETLPLVRADESPVTANRKKELVRNNKYFKCEEVKLVDGFFSNTSPKTFHILIPVDGKITVTCDAGEFSVEKGQPCLLPAAF